VFSRRHKSRDQSVFAEPHLRADVSPEVDSSESKAAQNIVGTEDETLAQEAERSVFDEPTFEADPSSSVPQNALTYERWLERMISETGAFERVMLAVLIVLAAGPLAVLGTFTNQLTDLSGVFLAYMAIVVFGPATEEVMKTLLLAFVVEKKPYILISRGHIVTMGVLSGLAFAAIENALYLKVYIPDPEPWLVWWRWTVCVLLHCSCSGIAAYGLAKVWHAGISTGTKPRIDKAIQYLVAAILIHGAYNGAMVMMDVLELVP
jgi:hypothetical protein